MFTWRTFFLSLFGFWVLAANSSSFFSFLRPIFYLYIFIAGVVTIRGKKKVVFMLNDFAATLACAWSWNNSFILFSGQWGTGMWSRMHIGESGFFPGRPWVNAYCTHIFPFCRIFNILKFIRETGTLIVW